MSRRQKRRGAIQSMRSVRSIREIGQPIGDQEYEINDGEEFQARDGSNVQTMAEAEAEDRRARRELRLAQAPVESPEPEEAAKIPHLVWKLVTSPLHLAVALIRVTLSRGQQP